MGGASKVGGGLGRVGRQRVRGSDSGGEGAIRGIEAVIGARARFAAGMRAAAARALGRVRRWRTKVFIVGGGGGGGGGGGARRRAKSGE